MDKKQFISSYIVQYIASRKAQSYNEHIAYGLIKKQLDHEVDIIEAINHAEHAWNDLCRLDHSENCVTDPVAYFMF